MKHCLNAIAALAVVALSGSACANVITDWDVNAVAIVPPSAAGLREIAIMHVAMFDAVNSIDRRYAPPTCRMPFGPSQASPELIPGEGSPPSSDII
jgi:hypothetical protein